MISTLKKLIVFVVLLVLEMALSDVLESERGSFFGFSREIPLSGSTVEVVEQLQAAVFQSGTGDRRVRRYFEQYDTPFTAETTK